MYKTKITSKEKPIQISGNTRRHILLKIKSLLEISNDAQLILIKKHLDELVYSKKFNVLHTPESDSFTNNNTSHIDNNIIFKEQ